MHHSMATTRHLEGMPAHYIGRTMLGDTPTAGRTARVRRNLRQGLALASAASPQALVRYSVLGMINAAMPPITVFLSARLVNQIAGARSGGLPFKTMVGVLTGLWLATAVQRAIGAYMGYGRNL